MVDKKNLEQVATELKQQKGSSSANGENHENEENVEENSNDMDSDEQQESDRLVIDENDENDDDEDDDELEEEEEEEDPDQKSEKQPKTTIEDLAHFALVNSVNEDFRNNNNDDYNNDRSESESEPNTSSPLATNTSENINPVSGGGNLMDIGSIYRGLYPINEVKKYFCKKTVGDRKLYECTWPNCGYKTWKYSQHISRHIYLKHIGIRRLECDIKGCGKLFKRPESLVQHRKNHSCGFGIDPQIMKNPNSRCGVKNIKQYFSRTLDNDIYVYQCKYGPCKFHTHNSGSIRRHVHNQHVCPYSAPANVHHNNHQQQQQRLMNGRQPMIDMPSPPQSIQQIQQQRRQIPNSFPSISSHQTLLNNNVNPDDIGIGSPPNSVEFKMELKEDEGLAYDPVGNVVYRKSSPTASSSSPAILNQNHYHPQGSGGEEEEDGNSIEDKADILENLQKTSRQFPMDMDDGNDDGVGNDSSNNSPNRSNIGGNGNGNNGLYSLKNFEGKYRKVKTNDGAKFICNQCGHESSTQIALVRHLWEEFDFSDFQCEDCNRPFRTEFSLYTHRKNIHRIVSSPPHSSIPTQDSSPVVFPALDPSPNHNHSVEANQIMTEFLREFLKNKDPSEHDAIVQQFQNSFGLLQQSIHQSNMMMIGQQGMNQSIVDCTPSLYKKISDPSDGSVLFQCQNCPNYSVRTKASMKKHLKNHHSSLLNENPTANLEQSISIGDNVIDPNQSMMNTMNRSGDQAQHQKQSSPSSTSLPGKKYKAPDKSGLYSLKKFPDYYIRKKCETGTGYVYECIKCKGEQEYSTKSQASMIRHIWQHIPQSFMCPFCGHPCENEFALYKHKKKQHPESTSQHNRTKTASHLNRSKSNPNQNGNNDHRKMFASSSSDILVKNLAMANQNIGMDKSDQNQLISNPKFITEQCQQFMNLATECAGRMASTDQEQEMPISMVKNVGFDSNNRSSNKSKTSRRSLQFKKYKYNHQPDADNLDEDDDNNHDGDGHFKENPEMSETNTEESEENEENTEEDDEEEEVEEAEDDEEQETEESGVEMQSNEANPKLAVEKKQQ